MANGVFWGLTPTIGLQTVEIVATWFVARRLFGKDSSLVQAMIWVWVNNPLTVVPMYYGFYVTGSWLMGDAAGVTGYEPFGALLDDTGLGWFDRASRLATSVGIALLIGCIPYAAGGAMLSYYWAVRIVRRRKERLARRRANYETFRTSDSSG